MASWSATDALATMQEMADRPIVLAIAGGQVVSVSGAELRRRTLGTAASLRNAGVARGTVVAIWAPNSANWIAAGLACHLLGAVLAPIDALLSADEACEQVDASKAPRSSSSRVKQQPRSGAGPNPSISVDLATSDNEVSTNDPAGD